MTNCGDREQAQAELTWPGTVLDNGVRPLTGTAVRVTLPGAAPEVLALNVGHRHDRHRGDHRMARAAGLTGHGAPALAGLLALVHRTC